MTDINNYLNELGVEFPDFGIMPKSDSSLMKVINFFLKVVSFGLMKTFMTTFTTTIGSTVYTPSAWDTEWDNSTKISILRHERIHILQKKRYTMVLFSILYLFVPLPIGLAYFRKKFEQEAYEESMLATAQLRGAIYLDLPEYRDYIIGQFLCANYMWTWPFRKSVVAWYDGAKERITIKISK